MAVSPESEPAWQEWFNAWMQQVFVAVGGDWEANAMNWYPSDDDEKRPAP